MADDGLPGFDKIVRKGLKLIGLKQLVNNSGRFNSFLKNFQKFIKNPPRYIIALLVGILLYIVNTISNALSEAVSLFEAPAQPINTALMTVGDLVGGGLIDIVGSVNQAAINFALNAGPLAPVGVFVLWLVEMWVLYQLILLAMPYVGGFVRGLIGGGS